MFPTLCSGNYMENEIIAYIEENKDLIRFSCVNIQEEYKKLIGNPSHRYFLLEIQEQYKDKIKEVIINTISSSNYPIDSILSVIEELDLIYFINND